jgi:hypothetical protein
LGTGSALVDGRGTGSGIARSVCGLRIRPVLPRALLGSTGTDEISGVAARRCRLRAILVLAGVAEELGLLRGLSLRFASPAGRTSCLELGALDVGVQG